MYPINVWFTWDPDKSDRNLAERGFDFEFASRIFDDVILERRIISAWVSSRKERTAYGKATQQDPG